MLFIIFNTQIYIPSKQVIYSNLISDFFLQLCLQCQNYQLQDIFREAKQSKHRQYFAICNSSLSIVFPVLLFITAFNLQEGAISLCLSNYSVTIFTVFSFCLPFPLLFTQTLCLYFTCIAADVLLFISIKVFGQQGPGSCKGTFQYLSGIVT